MAERIIVEIKYSIPIRHDKKKLTTRDILAALLDYFGSKNSKPFRGLFDRLEVKLFKKNENIDS